jgi:hypothetical protein
VLIIFEKVVENPFSNRGTHEMKLSGQTGYIHDRLTLKQRNILRKWWREHSVIKHIHYQRWAHTAIPLEICQEIGVFCHKSPKID